MLVYVDYKKVGERIAARRKELGLKQWQVNEMAGLSDKYLSNIERATSVLSIDVLMKLCNVLKTTPDYLLLGTENTQETENYHLFFEKKIQNLTPAQRKLAAGLLDWLASTEL